MSEAEMKKVVPTSRKFAQEKKIVEVDPTMDHQENDFELAEDAIFHAVETAEKAMLHLVEHAVEDEVETIFHELPHHEKDESTQKEKKERKRRCMSEDLRECLESMEHGDIE